MKINTKMSSVSSNPQTKNCSSLVINFWALFNFHLLVCHSKLKYFQLLLHIGSNESVMSLMTLMLQTARLLHCLNGLNQSHSNFWTVAQTARGAAWGPWMAWTRWCLCKRAPTTAGWPRTTWTGCSRWWAPAGRAATPRAALSLGSISEIFSGLQWRRTY